LFTPRRADKRPLYDSFLIARDHGHRRHSRADEDRTRMHDEHIASEALNEAWDALYDSLPARWHIGKLSYEPERAAWSVTAWDRAQTEAHHGRASSE
jgi:hypothetical protein